jgi:glycosyltransferase involved in cell wall biosynthesis
MGRLSDIGARHRVLRFRSRFRARRRTPEEHPLTSNPTAPQDSALDEKGLAEVRRVGTADLMVGIPSFGNAETIGYVVRAAQAGMVQYFPDLKPILVNSDGGSPDDTPRVAVSTESPDYIEKIILVSPRHKLQRISFTYQGISGKGTAVRALFEVARELKVRAFVMVDSDLRSIVPEWIELLAGPILKGGYDFVAPMYARYKYDGTITNNIAYPLTRALYGARIRQPIGGEFAVSGDLVQRYLELESFDELIARFGIDIWMTHSAINEGFAVCQARLGAKIHDAKDPASDLGPMFRQVVGTLFRMAGRYEDRWLRVRGSHAIPEYGFERVVAPEMIDVNHAKLIDNFENARFSQRDVWSQMLSAEQLERVMALEVPDAPADFHFPAELWIRCLYDTMVAFHRPGVDRDQLLAALTPLYFGRTAGFIGETLDLTTDQAERVIDAQAREFEELKPYLVARWREMRAAEKG